MAQITRPTKILDSIHYAYSYGTYGCIFASTNSALALTFFVLLFLEFRTKAPGARTIAQFVRSRFGPIAHITTIVVTLMTSIYSLIINVNLGSMVMDVASVSVGRIAMVSLAFILVGALLLMTRRKSFGTIICLFVLAVLCITAFFICIVANVAAFKPLDNTNSFYKLLLCFDNSKRGFETSPTMEVRMEVMADNLQIFGLDSIVRIFMDQAIWETLANLPPNHGIIGLLLAILMAFCIPVAFGIVCGLGFRALESAFFNERLLNEIQIQSGWFMILSTASTSVPHVPRSRFYNSSPGLEQMLVDDVQYLLTGLAASVHFSQWSRSISGASSILYYDVLATYIKVSDRCTGWRKRNTLKLKNQLTSPFKKQVDSTTCLLCGKRRGQLASQRNICRCRSMLECADCQADTWVKNACRTRPSSAIVYGCRTHGAYRAYADEMSSTVLQIAFTITAGMIPIFNMLNQTTVFHIDVQYSRLIGLSVGVFGGFLLPILITLITTRPLPPEVALSAWSSVQEIDNPLAPWPEVFTRQTDLRFSPRLSEKKPALGEVRRALASLRRLTISDFRQFMSRLRRGRTRTQ
ncbi:hypothetical protein ACTXT7_000303 [Hymenolepis weldensis]